MTLRGGLERRLARSHINRYASLNKASEEKWGPSYLDAERAYRTYRALAEKHSEASFPLVRAEALFHAASVRSDKWGVSSYIMRNEERTKTLEQLLNVYTLETHPVRWAVINTQLASCFQAVTPQRFEDAKQALERALTVLTEEAFPNDFKYCNTKLQELISEIAKSDAKQNQEK